MSIRPGSPDDSAIVHSAWIGAVPSVHPWSEVDKNWVCAATGALIDRLLDLGELTVACNPEYRDQVYGFIVHGPGRVMHWVYVKKLFRGAGVGRRLMEHCFGPVGQDYEPVLITGYTHAIGRVKKRWNLERRTYELCKIISGRSG